MAKKAEEARSEPRKLYRLPEKGMIAGVAAGMADYFNIDVTLMRVLFAVATVITNGLGILAYIVMAIITPVPGASTKNSQNVAENVNNLANEAKKSASSDTVRNWLGVGLVVVGVWLMLGVFWPAWFDIRWSAFWPAVLIVIGLLVITRGRR